MTPYRLTLWQKYRRLTVWTKLGSWGSLASILSLPIGFISLALAVWALVITLWPARTGPPIQMAKVEFYEPQKGEAASANAYYRVREPSVRIRGNSSLFLLTPREGIPVDWEVGIADAWREAVRRWDVAGPGTENVVSEAGPGLYFTGFGPPLTKSNIDALRHGSAALFFAGQIQYSAQTHGTIEFCVWLLKGAKIQCHEHNGPADNPSADR